MHVTVIVCAYNAQDSIVETLDSLLAQTHDALEILIVDDASTDETPQICARYAARDPRVRVVRHDINKGLSHGRNTGLAEARHEILTFLDADDIVQPTAIETLLGALVEDDKRMGVSAYRTYFDEDRDLGIQKIGPTSREAYMRLYGGEKLVFLSYPNLVYKFDVLAVGGYRVDLLPNAEGIRHADFCEDLDLWCRMSDLSADGRYFLTLPEPLTRYRKPAGSMSTKNVGHMQNRMRWIKDCLKRRRAGQPEHSLADFIASRRALQRIGDWRSDHAAGFYKRAGFAYAQRKFGQMAALLMVVGVLSPKLLHQKIATQRVNR